MPLRLPAMLLVSVTLMVAPMQARDKPLQPDPPVTQGQEAPSTIWGGEHIEMEMIKDGATLEFDCATGTMSKPLAVNAQGKFQAIGTFTRERPGPTMRDGNPALAATYSGSIVGDTMHLHIVAGANREITEDYVLVRGQAGRVMKCK